MFLVAEGGPDPQLQKIFDASPPWIGGDCATSLAIGASRYLWLFQDTLIGTVGDDGHRQTNCMTHNSVATWTAGAMRHDGLRGECAGGEGNGFLSPLDESRWYWIETGFALNDRAYLFSRLMTEPCQVGCTQVGVALSVLNVTSEDPLSWPIERTNLLPGFDSKGPRWPTALVVENDWVYMLGINQRDAVALRVPVETIITTYFDELKWNETLQYYSMNDEWTLGNSTDLANNLSILFPDAPPETSLFRHQGRWFALMIPFGKNILQVRMSSSTSPLPGNEWSSEPITIYTIPEPWCCSNHTFAYSPKVHAEFSQHDDEIVVTYVTNNMDPSVVDSNIGLYIPRVIRLNLTIVVI